MSKKVKFDKSSNDDNNNDDNKDDDNNEIERYQRRKESQRLVAQSRASHFARADRDDVGVDSNTAKRSKKSSTPTGYVKKDDKDDENVAIGAFTVANQLIAKREEVKRLREEAIASGNLGNVRAIDVDSMDEYDKILRNLSWNPKSLSSENQKYVYIDSLTDMCIKFLVQNFGAIESLDDIPTEIRELIAIELAKQRKLLANSVDILATPGSETLILPDCSMLDEAVVTKCIESVADSGSIRILKLGVVGAGFGDEVAKKVSKYISNVESLELTGCYRLNDEVLSSVFTACHKTLENLNLSCDSRLSLKALSILSSTCLNLKTLKMDYCTHMIDEDLVSLVNSASPSFNLEGISIVGMTEITDETFILLMKRFGSSLTSINCSGCIKLTDDTIIAIKTHCSKLLSLGIGQLRYVTTAALIGLFMPDLIDENSSSSQLSTSIGSLQHVELQGVVNVTDDVIIQLSLLAKGSLLSLNIASCSLLTSKALIAMKLTCPYSLREIDMSFVRGISEDALGYFMDTAINMKLLSVWGCTQLTERFFNHTFPNNVKIIGQMNA
jgi:hypothetical protein